ncbi:MAG TPA: hypothetical protein VE034_09715, partial [Burkholderiales bacterium]|nr:hypothetical protein [Burkholderiales bacterium]
RLLLLHAPATDLTFALMLTIMLAGIAAGGALAPLLAPLRFVWVAAGCGLAVVLGYALALPARLGVSEMIFYAIPLMLPAAVLSGALFTLLGAELRAVSDDPQAPIGRLVSANTLGGACGAALAGFVLLPRLGIEASLLFLAGGYALLPLLFVERRAPWKPVLPATLAALGLLLFPSGSMQAHLSQAARIYQAVDGSSVAEVTQGPTTTLQLLKRERFGEPLSWRLVTDHYSMSGGDRTSLRYMQLFAWLPLSLHPAPRRALLISYGVGNTAGALLGEPELEALTVVDVSPEILAASRTIHGAADPLLDARVRVVLEDGRHYLRTRRESFDLITGEPPPPAMAGVVNLYTREYFTALAARLAPGGLASYWLPVRQFEPRGAQAVIAAFCQAFPDCSLWAGTEFHWILLGGRDFLARPGPERLTRLWRDKVVGPRITASGFEHPGQLGAIFLGDAEQLRAWYAGTPALDDDHPKRMAAAILVAPDLAEYARWLDPGYARRRFEGSAWIAAHWPAELVRASGPFFSVQPVLNSHFSPDPVGNLPIVDDFLRKTDLRVPVLWLLNSDVPEQTIVSRRLRGAGSEERNRPEYAYTLGVGALAQRNYAEAAAFLARAAKSDPGGAGPQAAYALCRAGRAKQAAGVPGAERLAPELRCWAGKAN